MGFITFPSDLAVRGEPAAAKVALIIRLNEEAARP
jgi:hypothetical protein